MLNTCPRERERVELQALQPDPDWAQLLLVSETSELVGRAHTAEEWGVWSPLRWVLRVDENPVWGPTD